VAGRAREKNLLNEQAAGGGPGRRERRALWLLAAGSGLGLLLAAYGLLDSGAAVSAGIPENAVAVVNGAVIDRADYMRLLAGLENDSRNPIDDAARRHVLDRMIDEELLVQRAVELGLVEVDRRVRAGLTSSLIASVVNDAEDRPPDPGELRAFYAAEKDFFTQPGRLRVQQIFFRVPRGTDARDAIARAAAARAEIAAGASFESVAESRGDDPISDIPDALLPALKLREYIGPSALERAMALAVGEVSEPVQSGVGVHLLRLVDRREPVTPEFESIAPQVEAEWRRRAGDRALREYLDTLRSQADVWTARVEADAEGRAEATTP
jgi:hypothetical protein